MAGRANHKFVLGAFLGCAAALACLAPLAARAEDSDITGALQAHSFPVVSDARLAGDDRQTRFILDLDKKVPLRAFARSPIPYRVVVDLPQVNFRLPAGAGASGRGLIKAFRYGLVMPGGSRVVLDLAGPARIESPMCWMPPTANRRGW